jgi:sulfonate transport system permease protein
MTIAAPGEPASGLRQPPYGLIGVLAAIVLWELAARLLAGSYLLAGPIDVAIHIAGNAGLLWRALLVTLQAALIGFVFGNLAAIVLALIALLVPRAERLVAAVALVCFCLPLVATGPILRVVAGPGEVPQIVLAALAVYYTTYLTLMVGLRAAPAGWFDLVRSYGRGPMTELFRVRAQAALPYFIAGLQIAAPAAFLGAMVGEFTGAERGMGVLAIRAMRGLDVDATWAIATIASSVSMLAYWALGALGRRIGAAPPPSLLAPPPQGSSAGRGAAAMRRIGLVAGTIGVVLLGWWGAMEALDLNSFFAKRPADIWAFLVSSPAAAENREVLFSALLETVSYTLPGYFLGLALGAGLAALVMTFPVASSVALPFAIALRSVPIVTTAPLVVLALGRGAAGTVTIVAIMIFFPTLVACLQGMRQTPGQVLDVFDSYAAGRWSRLAFAQVPAMLPAFFASARMAVPAAILAVTTAEWLATGTGIGSLMAVTASTSAYAMLWSSIVVIAGLSSLLYCAVALIERRVLARYASEQLRR